MKRLTIFGIFFGLLPLFVGVGLIALNQRKMTFTKSVQEVEIQKLEAVAALGQLQPAGEIRRLAAPSNGMGGTPRVSNLLVREGDVVEAGETLAIFDNRPQVMASIRRVQAGLNTLQIEIKIKKREFKRYEQTAIEGATSLALLDEKKDELIKLIGAREELLAELSGLEADLSNTELKSPIEGLVLHIHARVGERPDDSGVLEVGANQNMEALIEVYESDIDRVKLGQSVSLISENGGFIGTLNGVVDRISPQVRQRKVLSTDPTGDADARVIEVGVKLNDKSSLLVSQLTGLKVIARFVPL